MHLSEECTSVPSNFHDIILGAAFIVGLFWCIMVMSHRREASLRNYIVRFFKWTKNLLCYPFSALSGRSHQSLQPSVTVLSPRAIFMFLWIRLSFIHKTNALNKSKMCWIRPAELFQIVYFSRLWTLMRWHFLQLLLVFFNISDYLNHSSKLFDWII